MDAVVSVIEAIKCFKSLLKSCVKLVCDHHATIKDLSDQFKQLENVRIEVQSKVDEAKNNGEEIIAEVEEWLEEIKTFQEQVRDWSSQNVTNDEAELLPTLPTCRSRLNCYQRYKLSKEAIKKKLAAVCHVEYGKSVARVSIPPSPKGIKLQPRGDFIPFISVQECYDEIITALKERHVKKVGVFGMGGIGKTTLVNEVGYNVRVEAIFDEVVSAAVSQEPDILSIQNTLGEMLRLKFSLETEIGRASQLKERLRRENRVLVILDDVWEPINLEAIGIPIDHAGCKILITTRRRPVCPRMDCQETIELHLLKENEAFQLFNKNVNGALNETCSPELKEVAERVIGECKRLPLALVAVACALRERSLEEWKTAADQLENAEFQENDLADISIYPCLKLSYDYLRGASTKKCFLLCSLFPEDHVINIAELAIYAQGYGVFNELNSFEHVKNRVKSHINTLVDSSLLLKLEPGGRVKMHDMFRDVALWITSTGEEVFFVSLPSHTPLVRERKSANATVISLLACPENEKLPDPKEGEKLKMLLLAQRVPLQNMRDTCFERMTNLMVLDMTAKVETPIPMDLPSSIQLLSNLRVLYLRRWKLRGKIQLIGNLEKLETLSFAGSVLWHLPKELLKLPDLRILDLSSLIVLKGFDKQVLGQFTEMVEVLIPPKGNRTLDLD